MKEKRFVLCSVLEFDDETSSVMELHRGTTQECEDLAKKIPAVCNSTGKKLVDSYLALLPAAEFDSAMTDNQPPASGEK